MRSTDDNIELGKPVTDRFLAVIDYVLDNRKIYKIDTITDVTQLLSIASQHYYALKSNPKRNVTVTNCIMLCKKFNVSANWLLLGVGERFMQKLGKAKKHTVKVSETADQIVIIVGK